MSPPPTQSTPGSPPRSAPRSVAAPRWWSVTACLIVLSLVPLVALGAGSLSAVSDRRESAARAENVALQVSRLFDLVRLRFALSDERAAVLSLAETREFGLDESIASMTVGINIRQRAADAAQRSEALRPALGTTPAAIEAFAPLVAMRAAPVVESTTEIKQIFNHAEDYVRAEALAAMRDVADAADRLADGADLQRSVARLAPSFLASEAAANEAGELFDTFTTTGDTQAQSLLDLAANAALRQSALADLAGTVEPATAMDAALRAVTDPDAFVAYDRAVTAMLSPGGLAQASAGSLLERAMRLAPAIRMGYERADAYVALVGQASQDVSDNARALHHAANDSAERTMVLLTAVVLFCALATLVVGRSLRRPLSRLELRSREVLGGVTDVAPLAVRGPREIRTVISATNQFVDNLAAVERQAEALAAADLDHPALASPAAGPLGHSLHRTFTRLAASLQAQAELQRQLSHDATHDNLTGIPNRPAAMAAVEAALHRAERAGTQIAVLFIDLDGFKQVNDFYGHGVGDEVLRHAVQRMSAVGRGGDLLARLGGDEFLLVASPIGDITEAVAIAERIIAAVSDPLDTGEYAVTIGASIGVALGSRRSDLESLIVNADLAVYQAKAAGKGRVEVYDQALRKELHARSELERELGAAIAADELELHYQPVYNLLDGRVHSVEALVRWNRGGSLVPPDSFIPIAELSPLIVELDCWVLKRACLQWRTWQREPGLEQLSIAVNVSARHLLSRSFTRHVRAALAEAAMDPHKLVIELTETALLADLATASNALNELRELGVRVAVDDFGTGHTSFAYLRNLPVDIIKIDRSYIAGLDQPDSIDAALATVMGSMAGVLGLDVVAEGIEADSQLQALATLGCHLAQGYHVSRPLTPERLQEWMQTTEFHAPLRLDRPEEGAARSLTA